MNKNDILKTLKKYNFDKENILILSGASMVINGIKETTDDIDIAVSNNYKKELLKKYKCQLKDNKVYSIDNLIEFSTNYYDCNYEIKEDYKWQTPNEILKLKQSLNREKDQKDIELLKNYINHISLNVLALAYLGDAVYELHIRDYLICKGISKVNALQKEAINYVSAKAQSNFLESMIQNKFLTEEELTIIKRARNHKSHPSKSADIITYKRSTGLEALIGYLYLNKNTIRIKEIIKFIVGD